MYIKKQRIFAADEQEPEVVDTEAEVTVDPEATDLLFETEDVANLIAEVTESEVEVEVSDDGDTVEFTIGDDVFTVEAEGDEEVLEASKKITKKAGSRKITANRKPRPRREARKVTASTRTRSRSVRRVRK